MLEPRIIMSMWNFLVFSQKRASRGTVPRDRAGTMRGLPRPHLPAPAPWFRHHKATLQRGFKEVKEGYCTCNGRTIYAGPKLGLRRPQHGVKLSSCLVCSVLTE